MEEAEEAMTELRQRLALSGVWEEAAGMKDQIIEWAKELQSLAQAGLFYGRDPFDQERYGRIREISAEMLADRTGIPVKTVQGLFCNDTGYQTPKVDTRAAVFQDGKILLVQERDGLWSMPGGWCEYNLSPAENTVKEAREEAGVHVAVKRLISVQDRDKHNQPPYAYGVVKIFYLCELLGGGFTPNLETTKSGYFSLEELPPLAEAKCNEEQVHMCFQSYQAENWSAQFD
ncbi:NUDIX hydrolase N-terminal domain-containing protein [Acutalibacter sp. 1XD8-33]|uniref:NUDIX hydrolase N-terminal domain-containing protein n=1 Tax=Acutalibacter sp. 1XD8-33 TaxID=2320081 RepID=UPI003FA45470